MRVGAAVVGVAPRLRAPTLAGFGGGLLVG